MSEMNTNRRVMEPLIDEELLEGDQGEEPVDQVVSVRLTRRTFSTCVGRAPRDGDEMREFARLWQEYEWEEFIRGGWAEHFQTEDDPTDEQGWGE